VTEKNILAIDVGNSRIKWAVYSMRDNNVLQSGVVNQGEGIAAGLDQSFNGLTSMPVWMSHVGRSETYEAVRSYFIKHWYAEPYLVQAKVTEFGVVSAYTNPSALGVDRWMAIIAAWQYYEQAFCVIDLGTAITIDCVDGDGLHLGGVIMPGVNAMYKSLSQTTTISGLAASQNTALAGNTADAVAAGVWCAVCGGVERALEKIKRDIPNIKIVLCGGDAAYLANCLEEKVDVRSDLVMEGIVMVAKANDA
jgi:type III pantothenate kinase